MCLKLICVEKLTTWVQCSRFVILVISSFPKAKGYGQAISGQYVKWVFIYLLVTEQLWIKCVYNLVLNRELKKPCFLWQHEWPSGSRKSMALFPSEYRSQEKQNLWLECLWSVWTFVLFTPCHSFCALQSKAFFLFWIYWTTYLSSIGPQILNILCIGVQDVFAALWNKNSWQ